MRVRASVCTCVCVCMWCGCACVCLCVCVCASVRAQASLCVHMCVRVYGVRTRVCARVCQGCVAVPGSQGLHQFYTRSCWVKPIAEHELQMNNSEVWPSWVNSVLFMRSQWLRHLLRRASIATASQRRCVTGRVAGQQRVLAFTEAHLW